MRIAGDTGGNWPDERQELVLRAAVLDGKAAVEAWEEFYAINGLEEIPMASFQQLPLVWWNLNRLGYQHEVMGRLRGIHRRSWYESQKQFHQLALDLPLLDGGPEPLLLLKGGALALTAYADTGLRRMSDFDFVTPPERTQELLDRLEAEGWRRITPSPKKLNQTYRRCRHAIGLEHPHRSSFDIHWHILFRCGAQACDEALLEDSREIEFRGFRLRILGPAAQLLHTLEHGLAFDEVPPIRWVADAMTLLRGSEVNWERLAELSERFELTLAVRRGLRYLKDRFEARVPEPVLERLQAAPVSQAERAEFDLLMNPWLKQNITDTVRGASLRYLRGCRADGRKPRLFELLAFLEHQWKIDSIAEVPPRVAHSLWRRTREAIAGAPAGR